MLGLQFVIAMVGDQGDAAAQEQVVESRCTLVKVHDGERQRGSVSCKDRMVCCRQVSEGSSAIVVCAGKS